MNNQKLAEKIVKKCMTGADHEQAHLATAVIKQVLDDQPIDYGGLAEKMVMLIYGKADTLNAEYRQNKVKEATSIITQHFADQGKACNYYVSGMDTAMNCINCGRSKWEHEKEMTEFMDRVTLKP